ncbi:helix-turn-helix domain-containing protein [Halobacillus sp. K22]|uniref:helix-turn-helix domain-containing protein n=1 Tax=Halobacillus sp. K22 TaxID=3457431 RepID=UPI003FCE9362
MFTVILLTCVRKLNGERTISGIYNLLTGKRSSQTLQDAKGYALERYFGIYERLDRDVFEERFKRIENNHLIYLEDGTSPIITPEGVRYLDNYRGPSFEYFSGMNDHRNIREFEYRLLLVIQTITSIHAGNYSFIPVIEDPKAQRWVKRYYASLPHNLHLEVEGMYNEILALLNNRSQLESELFTFRLSGAEVIGLTYEQLKHKYKVTTEDAYLCIQHVLYYLFHEAKKEPRSYPFLFACTSGLDCETMITQSAKHTYHYLKEGWTLEAIVDKRRLKKSTIQDHIVEAALVIPDFSIDRFLSDKDQQRILTAADHMKTLRLKQIHQALNGQFNYFQIRLALAKGNKLTAKGQSYADV